ncbi:hypothetical protein L0P88_13610 [Muricauda sp. SCSIO 64092]|uniref:hypothetical protein n=1 Tax=Allomuricauda sp. SCSIO 64092 TaxID=2908842 RepID=UPI001FF6BC84|nr:hypothetical protein [Muricauda sp. SCSIO 64092]UOY04988.1 hypothetical protein L0P88_13610 [Muricauda sp. SCSIO 64092]
MTSKEKLDALEAKISKGLTIARKKMIAFKKYKNTPVVVSSNGKVIHVRPEDMEKEQ